MQFHEYIPQALRTRSTAFHTDQVEPREILQQLAGFEGSALYMDLSKKAIFYGKKIDRVALMDALSNKADEVDASPLDLNPNIVHALYGMITELGEMSEVARHWMDGGDVGTRLVDETGDFLWYLAGWCDELGIDLEAAMVANIAKLRARFPSAFDTARAINPDKAAETAALVGAL